MDRVSPLNRLVQRLRCLSPRGRCFITGCVILGAVVVVIAVVLLGFDRAPDSVAPAAIDGAQTLYDSGDFEAAASELKTATRDKAPSASAQRLLARAAEGSSDFAAAEKAYRESLRIDEDQPEVRYQLAVLLAHNGDTDEAIGELQRVVEQQPDFAGALITLGDLEAKDGRFADARLTYQHLLDLKPYGMDMKIVRARLAALKGAK